MRRVQAYKNKSREEEGQGCTWCWETRGFSSPPLDLFAFALHLPTHPAWRYGKPDETNRLYKLLFESVDFILCTGRWNGNNGWEERQGSTVLLLWTPQIEIWLTWMTFDSLMSSAPVSHSGFWPPHCGSCSPLTWSGLYTTTSWPEYGYRLLC